jgi:hypothetical protein
MYPEDIIQPLLTSENYLPHQPHIVNMLTAVVVARMRCGFSAAHAGQESKARFG